MVLHNFRLSNCIALDFEFRPQAGREGNPPEVICMVAHEIGTGKYHHLFQEDLYRLKAPPFPVNETVVVVAYFASAEMSCGGIYNPQAFSSIHRREHSAVRQER